MCVLLRLLLVPTRTATRGHRAMKNVVAGWQLEAIQARPLSPVSRLRTQGMRSHDVCPVAETRYSCIPAVEGNANVRTPSMPFFLLLWRNVCPLCLGARLTGIMHL